MSLWAGLPERVVAHRGGATVAIVEGSPRDPTAYTPPSPDSGNRHDFVHPLLIPGF